MLKELHIQNFAIISDLVIQFSDGLVILTGETGAGKSIILDALSAVLGQRLDSGIVRQGEDKAYVEALFEPDDETLRQLQPILDEEGLLEDGSQLLLSREIRAEGRSIARVNGRSVNLGLQAEIGSLLVDVHGQSEHLSLLKVKSHRELLDRFARNESLLDEYQEDYRQWQSLEAELRRLEQLQVNVDERLDILRYQIGQIDAAKLSVDEEESLRQERTRLANAEVLSRHARSALQALDESDPESFSVTDLLGNISNELISLARIDPQTQTMADQVEGALTTLSDLAYELRRYSEQIEFNPARLDQIELRIDLINNLKRKHGGSVAEVLNFYHKAQDELEQIENVESQIQEIEKKIDSLKLTLIEKALRIQKRRQEAARDLAAQMQDQLKHLEMKNARLKVMLAQKPDPDGLNIDGGVAFDAYGVDQVEFLIETNPGEGFKALAKIASGGETSRLMLALKNVLADADQIPTLVFDEIDSGIGGRVGMTVGELLWRLSQHHQVMCVTHLPQLAAFGDQHLKVNKLTEHDRTTTQLIELEGQARSLELAEMLGSTSEKSLQTANELLETVKQITGTI
ncbi:MAG: DNA repair protein RecN [Anaerolineaceae bacterium]|jgi:DNA repair protein RecN (Recombination protein N)